MISTTGRIKVTLEIDWPHSFGKSATAEDIYTTVARECTTLFRRALDEGKVKYRIVGDIEPVMVIHPVKK